MEDFLLPLLQESGNDVIVIAKLGANSGRIRMIPNEMIGADLNIGKEEAVKIISEALSRGKFATTDVFDSLSFDEFTMERLQDGESRCYSREYSDVEIDSVYRVAVLKCTHKSIRASRISSANDTRLVDTIHRIMFRFNAVKLFVDYHSVTDVYKCFLEVRPGSTSVKDAVAAMGVLTGALH